MQLKLTKTIVKKLQFNQTEIEENVEHKLSFGLSAGWNKENPSNHFSVLFDFQLHDSSGYELNLEFEGLFETEDVVDEEFMNSSWPQVNGAAIVYPFLRAFVSTLTINAGYDAAVIPSVNFQQMYSEQLADLENAKLEKH